MTITILTAGTRGDTQPYIALGLELKKSGHNVRITASESFEEFIRSFGLDFYPVKGDVSSIASSEFAKDARNADNPLKFFFSFNKLKSFFLDMQKDFFHGSQGSDAIVYHPGVVIGYFIAQHLKIPAILATPFPMTPTGDYPSMIFYDTIRLGRIYNFITHKIFEQGFWLAFRSPVKEFWKKNFGKGPDNFSCPYGKQNTITFPTVTSCSQYVFPGPYNTGYWFLDNEVNWEPPENLLNFLQKGNAPVYAGFGSIGDPDLAIETTEMIIDGIKRSGQRGILATGWNGMSKIENISEEIFILDSAPHSWLFPQMAAVIHHGGAGTTAAGLRAGVPGIIIPHSNDQFAWGRRIYELGAGPKPIPRKHLTSEKLSKAIKFALTKEIKNKSKELGIKIQSENGASRAAKIILNSIDVYYKNRFKAHSIY